MLPTVGLILEQSIYDVTGPPTEAVGGAEREGHT